MGTGVDGCKSGWIAVELTDEAVEVDRRDEFSDIHACVDEGTVLVDVPIGLPEGGRRGCDKDAKKLLGCRGNSVFYAPTRKTVFEFDRDEYEAANAESKERTGNGISAQAWSIVPKIKEINEFVGGGYDGAEIRETHPEVCFYGLGGRPMAYSKKTERGEEMRRQVLGEYEGELGFCVDEVVEEATEKRGVSNDDAIDALAAAVVACIGDEVGYEVLKGSDDTNGEIVYAEDNDEIV